MKRVSIPVVLRKEIVEEIEMLAKKQNISRSRLIESIVEQYLANLPNRKPTTFREKVIHWLLTGEEV